MTIRAIYFDMGGVILRTDDRQPRTQLGAEFGLSYEEIDQVVFGGGRYSSAARASLGAVTEEAHWHAVTRRLNVSPDASRRINEQFFAGDRVDWQLVDFLRGLRKTHKVGLISNAWDGLRAWIQKTKFDDAFDAIIISAEARAAKPMPVIYHLALQTLGVRPEEALFVDDVLENITGCENVGMKGLHFKSAAQVMDDIRKLI